MQKKEIPTNIYPFKVTNRNNRKISEIYSKLTTKTPERFSTVFIVYSEHILHLFLVLLLLTLNKQMFAGPHPINSETLK